VKFRETCLVVVVVVARVRDEVLYDLFSTPSTPLRSCQTHVLGNVRQAPRPLRCPLVGTLLLAADVLSPSLESERIQSRTLISGNGFTPPPLGPCSALIVVSLFASILPARVQIQLQHRFAFRVLIDPGCAGSSAAWPLADAHRRLCLHATSHASSALF
jgi:hypothetical protein